MSTKQTLNKEPATITPGPVLPRTDTMVRHAGKIAKVAYDMDLIMVLDMERMSRYREIYGEDYTFVAGTEYEGEKPVVVYSDVRGGDTSVM